MFSKLILISYYLLLNKSLDKAINNDVEINKSIWLCLVESGIKNIKNGIKYNAVLLILSLKLISSAPNNHVFCFFAAAHTCIGYFFLLERYTS